VFNGFDFDELTNLVPDPAYADVLREMAARMWQRIHRTRRPFDGPDDG